MTREEFIRQEADKVRKACLDCGYDSAMALECALAYADGMRHADKYPKSDFQED